MRQEVEAAEDVLHSQGVLRGGAPQQGEVILENRAASVRAPACQHVRTHAGTLSMVARCRILLSRAFASFSPQLCFWSILSSSAIWTPSLRAWALRWAPLAPARPGVGAAEAPGEEDAASGA